MKLGVISDEVSSDWESVLEFCEEEDVQHLEPRIIDDVNLANLNTKEIKKYANDLDKRNIDVICLASPILKTSLARKDDNPDKYDNFKAEFTVEEQEELTRELIRKAEIFEADYIRIFSGWEENTRWEEKLVTILEDVLDVFQESEVEPVLELDHMCNITTFDDFKKLPEDIRNRLNLLFDPGNYFQAGNDDILAEFERVKAKSKHMHIKNTDGDNWVGFSKGIIEYPKLLEKVMEYGEIESASLESYTDGSKIRNDFREVNNYLG